MKKSPCWDVVAITRRGLQKIQDHVDSATDGRQGQPQFKDPIGSSAASTITLLVWRSPDYRITCSGGPIADALAVTVDVEV